MGTVHRQITSERRRLSLLLGGEGQDEGELETNFPPERPAAALPVRRRDTRAMDRGQAQAGDMDTRCQPALPREKMNLCKYSG
jgi:hypothetical protein